MSTHSIEFLGPAQSSSWDMECVPFTSTVSCAMKEKGNCFAGDVYVPFDLLEPLGLVQREGRGCWSCVIVLDHSVVLTGTKIPAASGMRNPWRASAVYTARLTVSIVKTHSEDRLGIVLHGRGIASVQHLKAGSKGAASGLREGDKILNVNGIDTQGLDHVLTSSILRQPLLGTFSLTVLRGHDAPNMPLCFCTSVQTQTDAPELQASVHTQTEKLSARTTSAGTDTYDLLGADNPLPLEKLIDS
eukprot:CAMPEP_0181257840 /NCGR_PEP_ID=MMETSP1096-20121128/50462_1 /TAXON_ID=156174 ORGANISM="Chrysochromulina ericina, Strain CCMP281" /NCGR_SAMPLE_ID=MMETSP1096 /ASSEMBLY_ACC=CAM_ASM_000453 /LENGTH=244 /DNA_ID=CAMNT_0023356191 /DNA_START=211 /DNA_END=942 /DNA_ORIENTATION=+